MIKYCEFIGNRLHVWDDPKYKQRCSHISAGNTCLLHNKPLGTSSEGWTTCCEGCTEPIQVVELYRNTVRPAKKEKPLPPPPSEPAAIPAHFQNMLDDIAANWSRELKIMEVKAKLAKARYDALLKEGFTTEQALSLCNKNLGL